MGLNIFSRAALSLLAYCYYYVQDYVNAANSYEQLTNYYPEEEDYKVYYAQVRRIYLHNKLILLQFLSKGTEFLLQTMIF